MTDAKTEDSVIEKEKSFMVEFTTLITRYSLSEGLHLESIRKLTDYSIKTVALLLSGADIKEIEKADYWSDENEA